MTDFSRSEALLGADGLQRLRALKVAVIGVGGVGSWCAEALVRTGVGHVVLMDDDVVAPSNVNRQCPATAKTLARPKVEVMAERLREICPDCEVTALNARYVAGSDASARLFGAAPDVVVDAIDSVDCKAELILATTAAGIPLFSSMGAALRFDPTKVVVRRFDRIEGDGLARALRQRFRRLGRFPSARFSCVCSTEVPVSRGPSDGPPVKGSLMPVTCAFGMTLAAEVIRLAAPACAGF